MYKTYKYRLFPTKEQTELINLTIYLCRKLNRQVKSDIENNVSLPFKIVDKIKYYTEKDSEYLQCNKYALFKELAIIDSELNGYKTRTGNSFEYTYLDIFKYHYPVKDKKLYVPDIGWIKKANSRHIDNDLIKTICIAKGKDGYYYANILIEFDERKNRTLDINKFIAFDYSNSHFMVDDNGNTYDVPHFQRDQKAKIAEYQKKIAKTQDGSIRNKYYKNKLRKLYRKILYRRNDYLHKLSTELAETYDYIAIETLDVKSMASHYGLGASTYDNGYPKFTMMLDYKMKERGKKLIYISRWFPSSKTCSNCGYIHKYLKLKEREWECPSCKTLLNRDLNAAKNIKNEAMRMLEADG